MADEKDLFAPPTEQELFAPPNEDDLQEDLFAAPSEQELMAPPEMADLPKDDGKPGKLMSATLGLGEGYSFGTTPILGGVASAAGEVVSDIGDVLGLTAEGKLEKQGFDVEDKKGLEGLLQSYYEGRDIQKEAQAEAFATNPWSYGAGLLLGSLGGGGVATAGAKALAAGGSRLLQIASKALPTFTSAEKFKKAGLVE